MSSVSQYPTLKENHIATHKSTKAPALIANSKTLRVRLISLYAPKN